MPTWLTDILNFVFSALDKVVYYLINQFVSIFDSLAKLNIFENNSILNNFITRMYTLISIVMIFKVSFSILQYIINPDSFSNNEKGFGKIIQGIVITIAAIVMVPWVFSTAYDLQKKVVDNNVIPAIILGVDGDQYVVGSEAQQNSKRRISFMLAQAFVVPNLKVPEITYNNGYKIGSEPYLDSDGKLNGRAANILDEMVVKDPQHLYIPSGYSYPDSGLIGSALSYAFENYDATVLFDVVNDKYEQNKNLYLMEYRPLISTAAGVFVIILYLNFLIDLTIRMVKLGMLQLIAPIPIISMVDPKSIKSGMMNKWVKNCFSTYIGLFIRIATVNFVVLIVNILMTEFSLNNQQENGIWINIAILFGALMFAKDLPKLISDLTGINLNGDFKLNPFKRVTDNAAIKTMGAVGAAGLAGTAALGSNLFTGVANNKGFGKLRAIPSALAGAVSATGRGLVGAAKGEKFAKNYLNSYNTAMKNKQSRDDRLSDGVSWGAMGLSKFQQTLGVHTKGDMVDAANTKLESIGKAYQSMEAAAIGNDTGEFKAIINGEEKQFSGIKALQKQLEIVQNTQLDPKQYKDTAEYLEAVAAQDKLKEEFENAKKARLDDIAHGRVNNVDTATANAIKGSYRQMITLAGEVNKITTSIDPNIGKIKTDTVKNLNGTAKGVTTQIAGSSLARRAKTIDQYGARKDQK